MGSPGRGPWQVDRETDKIDAGPCRQLDLAFETTWRATQEREDLSRAVEGNGQCARRFGTNPQTDAIAAPFFKGQSRVVVNVIVGPVPVRRRL